MTDDVNSPLPNREFYPTVIQTLTKYDIPVTTNDYNIKYEGNDEDGYPQERIKAEVYAPYFVQHLDPIKLINECADLARELIPLTKEASKVAYLEWLIDECSNWEESDTEVIL